MKRILITVVLMLFSGGLLLTNGQSPSQPGSSSSRLIISEYGTLLDVLDADGKSRFGALKHAGFRSSYKLSGNKTKIVSAIGADSAGLRPGQIHVDGNSTSVTVTTDDGALEITSEFTIDDQTNQLIIRRTIKNTSNKKLDLQQTEYLDSKLMGTSGSTSLKRRASRRVKGSGCNDEHGERPPSAPCLILVCKEVHWPGLSTSGKRVSLNWKCRKTVDPGKEVHFEVQLDLR
jgi:hypothetical protein